MQQSDKRARLWRLTMAAGLALTLLTGIGSGARAQSVREESSFGLASSYRSLKKAAQDQNFTQFPDVREGGTGTIVKMSFDHRNADAVFLTSTDISASDLGGRGMLCRLIPPSHRAPVLTSPHAA